MYDNFNNLKDFLNNNKVFNLEKNKIIDYEVDSDKYVYTKLWENKSQNLTITYKLNNFLFRSRHFEKLNLNSTNILFGGCSQTFGEGLPEEYMWTNMLIKKLKKENTFNNITDYNIGMTGDSIDLCIKNVIAFIEEYGKPDYVFLCLPDIGRSIFYSDRYKEYSIFYMNAGFLYLKDLQKRNMLQNYKYEDNIQRHSLTIRLFEKYCSEAGINLFWTTWDTEDAKLYNELNFSNFIYLEGLDPDLLRKKENVNNYKFWEIAEDRNHFGSSWTSYLSDKFFEVVNDKIN
jgi:hypothetical protein